MKAPKLRCVVCHRPSAQFDIHKGCLKRRERHINRVIFTPVPAPQEAVECPGDAR